MSELICLSSDDEPEPTEQPNKSQRKRRADDDLENVSVKKTKGSKYSGWAPLSKRSKEKITTKVETEVREAASVSSSKNASKTPTKPLEEPWNRPSTSQQSMKPLEIVKASQKSQIKSKPSRVVDAPQLLIKEKRPVVDNHPGSEVFAQFLSLCLSRERSSEMERILEKLKRYYDQLDPKYARSEEFIDFLNEKRDLLLNDTLLYQHISDVREVMKRRKRVRPLPQSNASKPPEEPGEPEEVDEEVDKKLDAKLKKIVLVMEKCQKRINELEEAELDWDDEENSNYMKVSRYKERMMQLYYKYCELTGEHEDAGRSYLRPKYLRVTKIESVDQAIVRFINKRLTEKVKKTKKGQSAANCVIFPDYVDMLGCIKKCNKEQNLGMSGAQAENLAKKAFKELGEYLQKVRQQDFLETFSMLDDGREDPAHKDEEIAAKLRQSSREGKKRMDALLESFTKRQENGPTAAVKKEETSKENEESETSDEDEEASEADDDDDDDKSNDKDSNDLENLEDLENVSDVETDKKSEPEDESVSSDEKPPEEALDVPQGKNPAEIPDDNVTTLLKNEISDSQETLIITPPKKPQQEVVCSLEGALGQASRQIWPTEGTVPSVDKSPVQQEKEAELMKIQKPGPKCMKSPLKPTITDIRNVRVVIKSHEIVDINNTIKTCLKTGEINSEKSEVIIGEEKSECSNGDAKGAETVEAPEVSAEVTKEVEKAVEPEADVMIVDDDTPRVDTIPEASKTPETVETKTLNSEKDIETEKESPDCPESQEKIVIIDEDTKPVTSALKPEPKTPIKRIKPTRLPSSTPKIIMTSTPIKSSSPVTLAQNNKHVSHVEVIDEGRGDETHEKVRELSAITKDCGDETIINSGNEISLGESPELEVVEAVDDSKVEIEASIEEEDEKKPLLKLRSFAKPPEFWTSPPQRKPELSIKSSVKKSKTIELVDLDDEEEAKVITKAPCQNKTPMKFMPSGPSPSSTNKQRGAGVIRIATGNTPTSKNRVITQVKTMKNNTVLIKRNQKTVIIPYNRDKQEVQAPGQNQSNGAIPMSNEIAGLSSNQNSVNNRLSESDKKTMCLNPVNRAVLTKATGKVVNPVAKMNLSQKIVSSINKERSNTS